MDIENDVKKAVIDFCMEVIKEPLVYFNESDLHLLLAEKLYDEHPLLKKPEHKTNLSPEDNSERQYKTRLLHREYGGGERTRIDIVIFDKEDVKDISHSHLTKESEEDYLSPLFGFELGISLEDVEEHIGNDIKKLKKCKKNGYILHIIKNDNKEEIENKAQTINKKFKKVISETSKQNNDKNKIKIIALVLNLFKKQGEPVCEIFDKNNPKEWKPYEKIDDRKLEEIRKILYSQLN